MRVVIAALLLLATGCASAADTMQRTPPPPFGVPDLRGVWSGAWNGTPVTLLVAEQQDLAAHSGVYLGPVQLLGRRMPGVSGVLTSTIRGEAVSINVQGWLGDMGGGLLLVIAGTMPSGTQELSLRVESQRLVGTGRSTFSWGPQGVIEMTRPP